MTVYTIRTYLAANFEDEESTLAQRFFTEAAATLLAEKAFLLFDAAIDGEGEKRKFSQ